MMALFKVFPRRLTNGEGGFLTIAYCFPYCFLEIFVGEQGLDGRGQSRDGDIPPVPPPTRENPAVGNRVKLLVTVK